ncbi:uncharacterized protein FMAN_14212 [Fusarium mangiferae]|uniref:F-box domain-containing protein n=1 Tax=Fusarium mangiferae TaxID=192010 RepID=A0A1L7UBM0_FUSMA|nr:uncharacterized protein FMAN_14212 [Fusarium mangiferae]CVL08124.1 uncharacterized protein FMAN_14212 [Fusarium mangiferae]
MGPESANPEALGNLPFEIIHHISRFLDEFDVYWFAKANRRLYQSLEGEWFYDHVGPDAASPALLAAAEHGHFATVRRALEGGANINYQDPSTGQTALVAACSNGHETVVEYLLQQSGIEVNTSDRHGRTSLHLAALEGDEAIVGYLLSMRNLEVNLTDLWNATPLDLAVQKRNWTVVALLLDFGAAKVMIGCQSNRRAIRLSLRLWLAGMSKPCHCYKHTMLLFQQDRQVSYSKKWMPGDLNE